MSSSRVDLSEIRRYLGGGVLNTAVGFATIFVLTALSVPPMLANTGGYAVGLLFGFAVSRRYVFRRSDMAGSRLAHYTLAFVACFLANLAALELALAAGLSAYPAQFLAAATYTVAMYVACRVFVFR